MPRNLRTIVTEIADAWLDRMLQRLDEEQRGPHRSPCSRCRMSPLREALGTFGSLPHHLVHPLITRLDSVLDDHIQQQLNERLEELRFLWRERLDLDEDGDPPSSEWYELVVSDHDDAWKAELEAAQVRRGEEQAEVAEILRAFTDARSHLGTQAADRLVERALEWIDETVPDSALLDAAERSMLDDAVSGIVERWFIWLPTGAWRRTPAIPNGSRCAACDTSPFSFGGPHGAAHRVVEALDELVRDHVETFGVPRIEPPGRGRLDDYRDDVRRHVRATLDAHAYAIHRALRLHVLLPVESEIRRATEHLLVLPDPPEGGADPGGSR